MVLFNQKPLQSSISSLRNLFHKVCFPENVIIQSCPVYQNNTILSYFYSNIENLALWARSQFSGFTI